MRQPKQKDNKKISRNRKSHPPLTMINHQRKSRRSMLPKTSRMTLISTYHSSISMRWIFLRTYHQWIHNLTHHHFLHCLFNLYPRGSWRSYASHAPSYSRCRSLLFGHQLINPSCSAHLPPQKSTILSLVSTSINTLITYLSNQSISTISGTL